MNELIDEGGYAGVTTKIKKYVHREINEISTKSFLSDLLFSRTINFLSK
jgi:hypothetical protein